MASAKTKNTEFMKRKLLIWASLVGLLLIALYLCNKLMKKYHENEIVIMEETVVEKPRVRNAVKGYRRERIVVPTIPTETPTDEGLLVVEGNDSIELCTDIISGHPYRIIIEGGRQLPLCQLLNEMGDSIEWDFATQVLKFSNDSVCKARLMVGSNVFPFEISQDVDSIPEARFCNISFAEFVHNSQDSIHSGAMKVPVLGSATILFCTAAQRSDKLYLKVVHPGLLSVCVVYDETVCGYPLFWDNDSTIFEDQYQYEVVEVSSDDVNDSMVFSDF